MAEYKVLILSLHDAEGKRRRQGECIELTEAQAAKGVAKGYLEKCEAPKPAPKKRGRPPKAAEPVETFEDKIDAVLEEDN